MNAFDLWLSRRTRGQLWALVALFYLGLIGLAVYEVLR